MIINLFLDVFNARYKTTYCFTPHIDGDGVAEEKSQKYYVTTNTLYSGINIGPWFINFGFFPGPIFLSKAIY